MMKAFSRKQFQILAFPKTDYDAIICDGSIRAGKTSVMSVAFIIWAMQSFNHQSFGICSKTIGTAERNIILPLLAMSFMRKRYRMSYKTREKLIVFDGKHENTFFLFGGKDAASYQLIQGITLAGVLLDEVALMPRSFVDQAIARCSVSGRRLWFNCNPEGQLHWFNQEWILEAEDRNALHLHFTMDDNPSLAPEIREGYERMYSGIFYDRYIKGLWVSAEGVIYADMFSPDRNIISEEEVKKLEFEPWCWISSDFGIQNATVYLLWRKVKNKPIYVITDEWYYSGREEQKQKTVTGLVEGLKSFLGELKPKYVIIDPSAAALKVELRQKGFRTLDADNEVLNGIANTGKLLEDGYILVSEKCKHTIEEFDLYMWDEKAADNGEDVPIKENDHCLTGDTLVMTENGNVPIKELVGKEGMVWSFNTETKKPEIKPFHDCRLTQEKAEIYEIETEDGRIIKCTGEHPILTERGYVMAKNLTDTDRIISIY